MLMSRGGALGTQISVIHQSLDVEIDTVYVLATPARLPTEEEKVRLLNSTIMKNWHFLSLQNLLCLLVAEVEDEENNVYCIHLRQRVYHTCNFRYGTLVFVFLK